MIQRSRFALFPGYFYSTPSPPKPRLIHHNQKNSFITSATASPPDVRRGLCPAVRWVFALGSAPGAGSALYE